MYRDRLVNRAVVAVVFVAGLASSMAIAEQLNIRHYDTRDGIPQVQVIDVRQDANGYLWAGTYSGLARFNGQEFRPFGVDDGLPSNFITRLQIGPDGHLYIGTSGGLCRKTGTEFDCIDHKLIDPAEVNAIAFHQGRMWVGTDTGLLVVEDGQVREVFIPGLAEHFEVHCLETDPSGKLWIGSSRGLVAANGDEFELIDSTPLRDRRVLSLQLEDDTLWLGTASGLYRYRQGRIESVPEASAFERVSVNDFHLDAQGRLWVAGVNGLLRRVGDRFEHLSLDDGLRSNIVNRIQGDREGLIWLAHDEGLSKILPATFIGYTEQSGLLASFVRAINEAPDGSAWLGTRSGIQVVPRRDDGWQIDDSRLIRTQEGLPDNRVFAIVFSADGSTVIATAEGVVRWRDEVGVVDVLTEDHGLPSNEVHGLLEDSQGRMWISTTRGTVHFAEGRTHVPEQDVLRRAFALRIREDLDGRLWFTSLRHGLLILEPDGSLRAFRAAQGLTDEMLWDMAPSHDGSMWVGSNGDGLFRVWPDGRIVRYTTEDGLPDNIVWQLIEDDQQRLWAYTNRGLSRFDGEQFKNFSERDGLLHLEGGATGALQSSEGELWFASADGLMRYAPEYAFDIDEPPPVVIERVMANGEILDYAGRLDYPARSVEIQFAGLSFFDESSVRFRYRLVGAYEEWSQPFRDPRVTFANLGWGDYRFEVIAINPDGVESIEPAVFAFHVTPPVWARWWFLASLLALALLAIALLVRWRVGQIERRRARLQELVEARTRELSEANQRLRELSRTDQLSGLPNRRYLIDQINQDIGQSRQARSESGEYANQDLVFIMIDIDHFKQVNDRYGHDVGDRILCQQAEVISGQLRETDYVVRWGGEEFLVVARDSESSRAERIASRIIDATRRYHFGVEDQGIAIRLTCSAGVASYPFLQESPVLDWEQVVQIADIAVYQAKAMGRDCWVQLSVDSEAVGEDGTAFITALKQDAEALIRSGAVTRVTSRD